MKNKQFYFKHSDSEICYQENHFTSELNVGESIQVFEAHSDRIGGGIFWCREYLFCGDDSSETCGRQCKDYEPRNGKSGCCRHYSTILYVHGEKVTLTKQ